LSLDSVPSNPYEWSRDIFADKILNLCNRIIENGENDVRPLKDWNKFIEDSEVAYSLGMNVNEFLFQQCFTLLNVYSDPTRDVIPFFPGATDAVTPSQKCAALRDTVIDKLIAETSAQNQSLLLAQALNDKAEIIPFSMRMKFLLSAFDMVKGTEGEQIILANFRDYINEDPLPEIESAFPYSKKEYVELLRKSVDQFPKGMYANGLRNIINEMTRPNAQIRYLNQYLSSSPITMDVTLTNCNESWILVYDYSPFINAESAVRNRDVAARCRLMKAAKVSADGSAPFEASSKAEIGILPKGTYVVIPSATSDAKGIYQPILNESWRQPFTVSDISVMSLSNPDATTRLFVVDGANGKPIEGAQVKVYTRKNYSIPRQLVKTLTTDKDGSVTVSEERFEIEASFDGSKWSNNSRYFNSSFNPDTISRNRVQILSERALCHPGDSIKVAIIAYNSKGFDMSLIAGRKVDVKLLDANNKEVEYKSIVTDSYGRGTAEFLIPNQGLLGNWQIAAYDENNKWLGNTSIQVADYVAPTFFITSEHSEEEVNPGDVVRIKGQVLTYSGMPVADATVKYSVSYNPPMRWFFQGGATYEASVSADSEGRYEIELPTANLKETQFERGIFRVQLSATSLAGETQSGPTERFAIGKEYNIQAANSGLTLDISDSIPNLTFYVNDMLGRKVKKELSYKLKNVATDEVVAVGNFMSPILKLPSKNYPSAKYNIEVALSEDDAVKADATIIMWRKSDKVAPSGTSLWTPDNKIIAKKNESHVYVTVGSGVADRWIPAVLSSDGKIISVDWLHIEKDNLKIPVKAPEGNQKYMLNLSYLSNLDSEVENINILPASSEDFLRVCTESFRDKISAGDEERWSFRFYRNSGEISSLPALAVMTDASLNAITPFNWNFAPSSGRYERFYSMREDNNYMQHMHYSFKFTKYLSYSRLYFPEINNYGQAWGFYGYRDFAGGVYLTSGIRNEVKMSVQSTSRAMPLMKMAAPESAMLDEMAFDDSDGVEMEAEEAISEEAMDVAAVAGNGSAPESGDSIELRDTEFPVAFFKPYLKSDDEGIVNIDFTVPNFNTTWAFQLIGYDKSLQTAKVALETVASKPIMVSTHAPRFVRTGDAITLTVTVFNNSDATLSPKCRIELIDLISGKTIEAKDFNIAAIDPTANTLLSMSWSVPSDLSTVGFRAFAEADGHRDGEQALLPVLPASSPVVESTPFWIAPNGNEIEVKLPKFKDSDQVTLQYCDNPAWYCITALPDIVIPDSKSVTSKMRALFGNAVAYNLISSNANLKKGLETLLSDQNSQFAALKSNLEKDGNLKITELNNTPWVNNAESETLRMSRLGSLLNDDEAQKSINQILDDIRSLQDRSGGWSWCPEMQPSSYITQDVLRHFAMIFKDGAMKQLKNPDGMVKSAIRYVDAETVKDYKKYHKKGESLSYLLDWLYVRSSFPTSYLPKDAVGTEMNSIANKAYKDIAKEWKDLGIGSKAKAASLLWRVGDHKTASEILESLRQYASESPEKGMWFDNLNSGWGGMTTLQTTTLVLEAFSEIQPSNKIVDSLRQWLVLGRQYQDWKSTSTVETVNAILTSGSDWTANDQSSSSGVNNESTTEFFLKGKKINIPETAKLTGAFTMTLNAKDASKKSLTISRKGKSPAWGGVIAQYEAPILDVIPAEVPELSIRKSIVALVEGSNGELTPKEGITLEKGMKVRVTLFITAGRDMDYVAVTDERSACLEPTVQLSGFTTSDRVGFYREVRDSQTNLFFEWMPKGNHVISYDCTVSQDGTFSCGIATAQSQYSPTTVAHSAGYLLHVK
ncbi:MAG: hypothetical protein K2K25_08255, partial [Muribaculaceae bacterium]|nr:hypothetical protein [Muribaculaceae bacterium]